MLLTYSGDKSSMALLFTFNTWSPGKRRPSAGPPIKKKKDYT